MNMHVYVWYVCDTQVSKVSGYKAAHMLSICAMCTNIQYKLFQGHFNIQSNLLNTVGSVCRWHTFSASNQHCRGCVR